MKIVFMGTPDFAVPTLDLLVENGYEIVGVITATDKPAGRGKKLQMSAVKKYAITKALPILQPKNLKSAKFLRTLASLKADLQVVVAFRMLPAAVFEMPPKGTINLHGSLLPQYRGAAPINWAVVNGEKETGVTTFFIEQQIDTGKIIFQEAFSIEETDTAGTVHDRMMHIGAKLVLKTVQAIEKGDFPQKKQVVEGELKKAPKIFKETCQIDWTKSAEQLYNFIRGMNPYPTAFTHLNNKKLKIFHADKIDQKYDLPIGTLVSDNRNYLHVVTGEGVLSITDLQLESKKRMKIDAFLRGNKIEENVCFNK